MKKNYWLKLKEDFFKQPHIKKLRKIAGGDTYTIIYQKILLMSINTDGYISHQGIEKTLEEELALILDEDLENIKVTLQFLRTTNLIEENKNKDAFLLPSMMTLIGSETQVAERVRGYRYRKKCDEEALQCNKQVLQCNEEALQCNTEVTKCNKNVTPDIDIDIDIDKDKDKDIDKNKRKEKKKEKTIVALKDDDVSKIILYLNNALNTKYKTSKFTIALIRARLKEGFTVDNFKTVIDKKYIEWIHNPQMANYLRPQTLFGINFESYLNQISIKPVNNIKTFAQIRNENIINTGKAVLKKVIDKYNTEDDNA